MQHQTPNPFDSARLADGYATARPAVHPRVISLVRQHLNWERKANTALDVGCGAGLSTAPLSTLAHRCFGIEPSVEMLLRSPLVAPGARFAAGAAEALPIESGAIDLMTCAGSLNWADLSKFFPEARRVLAPRGRLVIYDFAQGANSPSTAALAGWHAEFKGRWPSPPCQRIVPAELPLAAHGLRLDHQEPFDVSLTVSRDFYLRYAMTETNVEDAIARGVAEEEIRDWCSATLEPVFAGEAREIVFRGFVAYASRSSA